MANVLVIIPTYNRADLVTNAIESVLCHIRPYPAGGSRSYERGRK